MRLFECSMCILFGYFNFDALFAMCSVNRSYSAATCVYETYECARIRMCILFFLLIFICKVTSNKLE